MKKKTKITLSILSLVIGLGALSASITYAWTKTSSTDQIHYINIKTSKQKNLLISDDKNSFVSDIKYEDKTENLYKPISSYPFKWFDSKEINSTVKEGYFLPEPCFYSSYTGLNNSSTPHEQELITDGQGYFSKHIYLSCDDNVYVTIDPDTFKLENDVEHNENRAKELAKLKTFNSDTEKQDYIKATTEKLNQVTNSIRFSLLYKDADNNYQYIVIDPTKDGDTYYLGILNSTTSCYYDTYWNSTTSEWYESLYGYIKDDDGNVIQASKASDFMTYYQPASTEDTIQNMDSKHPITKNDDATSFNAVTKKGTHHYDVESFSLNHNVLKEESYTLEDIRPKEVSRTSPIMIPVYKNSEATEVVLSVYMEGWDRDCINSTMGASFDFSLEFMIARETGK